MLWVLLQVTLFAFVGALVLIALSNSRALHRLGDYPAPSRLPRVSVLVPARDEAPNIGRCVRSLLAQEYPHYEVLVLDDGSQDPTGHILARLQATDARLTVLRGRPLPPGWQGKNWACHQLGRAARGELLLFTDADTWHHPRMLADAVAALQAEGADLLTVLPKEQAIAWAERLVVPAITWFFAFIPLRLARRLSAPALAITIGQFMLFRRQAYERIGGYGAIRDKLADDTALGRLTKAQRMAWCLVDGGTRVSCHMYHSLREVFAGFSRALYASFGISTPAYVLSWLWIALAFLEPLAVVLLRLGGAPIPGLPLVLAGTTVAATVWVWAYTHRRFGYPLYLAALYPLTVLLAIVIAGHSLIEARSGRSTWKGRSITHAKGQGRPEPGGSPLSLSSRPLTRSRGADEQDGPDDTGR